MAFWDSERTIGTIQKTEHTQTRILLVCKDGEFKLAISDYFKTKNNPEYRFAGKTVCIPEEKTKELIEILSKIE